VSHHLPHHPPPLSPHVHRRPAHSPARRLVRPRSRIEYFVFGLLAEMQGHEVQLYAILLDGALNRYPEVTVLFEESMPSGGALANPKDKALVTALEDKMIEAYGTALVAVKCKAAGGGAVDLSYKMLRPQHVGALFAAVERYKVAELDLRYNQLGAAGGALVAAALETNTTLTTLECAQLGPPSNQGQGLAVSLETPTLPALALLILASLCAQPQRQQARPRGWHGARRGPQEQHHPQDAGVCCPAIEPTRPCVTVFPSPPRFRASHALPRSLQASQHPPRPRLTRDQPFPACISDESRTRTAHTQPAHTQSKSLACRRGHCHPRPRIPRGPRPRPPLPTGAWRARAHPPACNLPVAGWGATASAPTPSRPSERPPAAASAASAAPPASPWCST
jgi:hypothetical protein